MDELVDIVDFDGNVTGKTCLKSEAHKRGYWHPCVHIWFYTNDVKILIQKRSVSKDTYPDLWDVSVAGHIGAGEKPIIAAQREILEEIGHSVLTNELKLIGNYKSDYKHHKFLIDREFHYIYIAKLSMTIDELVLQKEEVTELKLISIENLKEQILDKHTSSGFVPYPLEYFTMVFQFIEKQL